jgi:hypothetical protein
LRAWHEGCTIFVLFCFYFHLLRIPQGAARSAVRAKRPMLPIWEIIDFAKLQKLGRRKKRLIAPVTVTGPNAVMMRSSAEDTISY